MITVLTGENDFEISRGVQGLMADFDGTSERIEGASLQLRDLPDLLLGTTLFTEKRLVIIKNLSDNRTVWTALADYIPTVSDDIRLVLVEPKPDKRTKTYKALQKHANIRDHKPWGERETVMAGRWVEREAKRLGITVDDKAVRALVGRSLVVSEKGTTIDQWRLLLNLEKLAPLGKVGLADVEKYIEETPVENVFGLLETALQGKSTRSKEMIGRLEASEDPFKLFGLLSGQVFWLAALAVANQPSQAVARDFGAHPFILSKLAPYAAKLGPSGARHIVSAFAEADGMMKTSAADPWLLIERALLKVAALTAS